MSGVSRVRAISGLATIGALTTLLTSCALFGSQLGGGQKSYTTSQAHVSTMPTPTLDGVTSQFTPSPGITVTVSAKPTHGSSSSSSLTGGVTTIVPPRYPTPVATSGVSGGSPGSGASPSPTPTTSPSVTPTATIPVDDAQLVSYTPIGPITAQNPSFTITATYRNSGTSTWTPGDYTLKCRQFCGTSLGTGDTFWPSIAPGQSFTFTANVSITSSWSYAVNNTIWQMWSPTTGFFGQQVVIEIINHGWYLDFQEASPSCAGDGSVWTQQGSGGTVSCGASGLALAQGGPNGVALDLQSTPASYDPGNYYVKVHVHFTTTSASVFGGVVITEPTAAHPVREVIMVSPAGYMCYQTNTQYCLPGYSTQQVPASSDYDLTVSVSGSGTLVYAAYSPGGYIEGGITAGGHTGLIEVTASGLTDAAYFTNYTFYQYK